MSNGGERERSSGHSIPDHLNRKLDAAEMVVRLSDGGTLKLGEGNSVVRHDRRGQIVEVLRLGDSCYRYWLGLVRPGQNEKEGDGPESDQI